LGMSLLRHNAVWARRFCLASTGRVRYCAPFAPSITKRNASGYHTLDLSKDELLGDNVYTRFQPTQNASIGQLVDYVKGLSTVYQKAPTEMKRMIAKGSEAKIDTVMEYYSKKGEGEEIRALIEAMPLAGTQQAFLYAVQGYIAGSQLDRIPALLDLLESRKILSKLVYDLALWGYCEARQFDEAVKLIRRMEAYGYHADLETMMKANHVHD